MSLRPAEEPDCSEMPATPAVTHVIEARTRDLGGFSVRRVLPARVRRRIGPFAFFDHMGAVAFEPGEGIDVRPHPHIGLATVTYLFEGEILHRDSLGTVQPIRPGDVNWMIAGRGIVHSERTADDTRREGSRLHGLQLWVALPVADEEREPSFRHHPARTLPATERDGVTLRVLAGAAYGLTSPVETCSPLFYADALMPPDSELVLPEEYEERGAYVVEGSVHVDSERRDSGRMLVFTPGTSITLRAEDRARVVLVGGARLEGERFIDWNFVSSSQERIERAKRDWREGRFPKVPGDDIEFVPLPE